MTEPNHRASVERYVTQARLGPYLAEVGGDYVRAEELYVWNLRVSGAFHEVLGVFEVVLRNALCEELRRWHGKRPGTWLDDPMTVFDDRRIAQIDEARGILTRANKPVTEGRVVAELSLGFWRFLLSKRYQNSLWTPHLRKAFPGMRPQRRDVVYGHVEALVKLRNRIAHHEPIHRLALSDLHGQMLLLVSWIDPAMAQWHLGLSRVPSLLAARPGVTPGP